MKTACEAFLHILQSRLKQKKKKVKTSHFHIISYHEVTQQYIPGQGCWPCCLWKSALLPKGGNFRRDFWVLRSSTSCFSILHMKTPSPLTLGLSFCTSWLGANAHIMWPTSRLEPTLPTLWEVTLPPDYKDLHPSHFLLIIRIVSSFQTLTLALEKNSLETKTCQVKHPYPFNKSFY